MKKYKLKDLCIKITDGSHNPEKGVEVSEYLMLSSKNIYNDLITYENPRFLSKESFDIENKRTQLTKGDVLLTIVGTVGRCAVFNSDNNIVLQRSVAVIKPNHELVNSRFLMYRLISLSNIFESQARGVAQKGIYLKQLSEIEIIIPRLEIQQKIVEALDKSQELINKRKDQIEALDKLVKSKFIEMFGNVITNSRGWKTELLGNICDLKAGKNIKAKDIYEDYSGELYPCYGGNGLRGYVKSYSHEGNINLIGRQGALCGNVKYAKGKFYATEHAVVTQPKVDINSYWLHFVLRELDLNRLSTGAAQPGLTVGTLNAVEIPIVEMKFQNQFADFINQVDKLKFEMEKSLKELEDNFNSLMQRAFKGELF